MTISASPSSDAFAAASTEVLDDVTPVLQARGMTKRFPGVTAVDDVDLDVDAGEVHGLLGENGSGKSTLLSLLAGQLAPDAGEVTYRSAALTPGDPHEAAARGICLIAQEAVVAPELTVAENVGLGRLPRRGPFVSRSQLRATARRALQELDLDVDPTTRLDRLPLHQQQLVAIARAVALDAKVVMLDEPTSSLSAAQVEKLFGVIRRLRDEGVAILVVSHRLREIRELTQRVTVLRDGKRVGGQKTSDTDDDELIGMMVGRRVDDLYVRADTSLGPVVLDVEGLKVAGFLRDVSLRVRAGEVVGLGGIVGAGRTLLAKALYGLLPWEGGRGTLNGEPFAPNSPRQAMAAGVGLVPENRKEDGLLPTLTVRENIDVATLDRLPLLGLLTGRGRVPAQGYIEELRIRCTGPDAPVRTLSGGNQQKVVFARCLSLRPRLLVLDEPTRGVDVGAKAEIYRLIAEAAEGGMGVLVISSEMPELLGICHRIVVFRAGAVVGELDRDSATEEGIAALATGAAEPGERHNR